MDSPHVSVPSQQCSSPSRDSWRRSELYDVVPLVDQALDVLRRVARVEQLRPTGLLARGSADALEHGLEHLHDLIRLTGRPD